MKKIVVLFLSALYLVLSSGFTKNTHFCKGIAQETYFFEQNKEGQPCPKCDTPDGGIIKGCCKHETQVVKITENSQKVTSENLVFKSLAVALPVHFFKTIFGYTFPEVTTQNFSNIFSFIPIRNNLLYIFYCVYRI